MSPLLAGVGAAVSLIGAAVGVRVGLHASHRSRVRRRFASVGGDHGGGGAVPRALRPLLDDVAPEHDATMVWRWWSAALAVSTVAGLLLGAVPGALLAIATLVSASGLAAWSLRGRRADLADAALPLWIDASSRAVRSGASLAQALIVGADAVRATPLAPEVEEIAGRLREGDTRADVDVLVRSPSTPARQLVGRALAVAHAAGGPPGILLDGVSATLRERTALQREVRALATQARASAAVIGLAPLGFAVVAAASDPRVGNFLLRSPAGWACIVVGVVLDLAGGAWMVRLVRAV